MKTRNIILLIIVSAVLIAMGLLTTLSDKKNLEIQTTQGIVHYRVEQALTPKEQEEGLMNRSRLPTQTGMIFLFNTPRVVRMWMKNTLIPLDMIFFDTNGWVTSVHKNAKPKDLSVISSQLPVLGVLEVNAGETDRFGIYPGSRLHLEKIK